MATDVADSTAAASAETVTTELAVTGMTCGTCAARIQRKLGRLPGVEASVNYATGRARVTHPPEQDTDELVAAVRTLGFGATAAQPLVPAGGGVPAPRTAPESAARPTATSTTAAPEVEDAPDPELSELRHRALVCLALTLPVMAVAMNPDWQFRYWQWFCLVLTAPVVIWGGYRFHRAAARHLRHLSATMDTLVSVGTLAAFGWSLWTLFFGGAGLGGMRHALYLIPRPDQFDGSRTVYLEAAAAITTAALLGRWIELRGRRRALGVSSSLMAPPATEARVVVGDRELPVPVGGVQPGDRIAVGAGEPFPLDGRVVEGRSTVDAGAMTGESAPVDVEPGTEVLAGTRNETARLVVETTRAAGDTQWARMARRVEEAQAGKTAIQRLADRISAWFVPVVILVAINTLLFWGVSAPAGASRSRRDGRARRGLPLRARPRHPDRAWPSPPAAVPSSASCCGGPRSLESTRRVDTIVLDKTGTVTTGRMTLQTLRTTDGVGRDEVLARAGALEARLEHPVARAIAAAARDEVASTSAEVTDVAPLDGLGVVGTVDGVRVLAGRHRLFVERGVDVPADLQRALDDAAGQGATTVLVAWDDESGVLRAARCSRSPTACARARTPSPRCARAAASGAAHRRQPRRGPRGRRGGGHRRRRRRRRGPAHREGRRGPPAARRAARPSRWSATASTTPRPSRRPTSAWRWAPAPPWPSRPATSPSSATTCAPCPSPCAWPAARSPRSAATCSGPSPTTSRRSRWPSPGC